MLTFHGDSTYPSKVKASASTNPFECQMLSSWKDLLMVEVSTGNPVEREIMRKSGEIFLKILYALDPQKDVL